MNKYEEILLFLEYAVPDNMQDDARAFLEKHKQSSIILRLAETYYKALPEAREEAILKVVVLGVEQGLHLLGVGSERSEYLYCVDNKQAVYLGEYGSPVEQIEVWQFFGFSSMEDFVEKRKLFKEYDEFIVTKDDGIFCIVCAVQQGELHEFGCTVEICPWCDGQLSICNCRFEQLGIEEITSEEELEKLRSLLEQKGRVPFSKDQAPSYPVAGEDSLS